MIQKPCNNSLHCAEAFCYVPGGSFFQSMSFLLPAPLMWSLPEPWQSVMKQDMKVASGDMPREVKDGLEKRMWKKEKRKK